MTEPHTTRCRMKTTRGLKPKMNLSPRKSLNPKMNPSLNLNPKKNPRQSLNPKMNPRMSLKLNPRLAGASFAGFGLCSGLLQGMCL